MHRAFAFTTLLMLALPSATFAPAPRPAITGLCFVRLKVSSFDSAGKFYGDYLGLPRFNACWAASAGTCFFITPYQDLEIVGLDTQPTNHLLDTIGLWTEDAGALRGYFLARGLKPGDPASQFKGEQGFEISDPEEHHLVFLSVGSPGSLRDSTMQVSNHMIHAGFVVHDRAAEDHFYKDILGFRIYWHGGRTDTETDWVDMQVPDGTDWLEYMLNVAPNANHKTLGVMNHIALGVADIHEAEEKLIKNGWKGGQEPKSSRNGKWQLNLYDPEETRVELMEFTPTKDPCCAPYNGSHPGHP